MKLGVYQTFFLCFSCLNFYFIFSALDLCAEISGEILFFFPWSSQGKGQNSEVLPQPFSVYLRAYIRKPTEIVTLQSSLLYAHISDFTSPLCSSLGLCLPCIWYPLRQTLDLQGLDFKGYSLRQAMVLVIVYPLNLYFPFVSGHWGPLLSCQFNHIHILKLNPYINFVY